MLKNKIKSAILKIINNLRFLKSRKKILKLRNSHLGERCFIIGNGPSLTLEDLDKIKGEFSIASHGIYDIFSKTDWRPNIYTAQDSALVNNLHKNISKMKDVKLKIIALMEDVRCKKIKKAFYISIKRDYEEGLPKFSKDVHSNIFEGMTVSYMNIQLAVYMGFKEIYLLGVDHSYAVERREDGSIKYNDVKSYFSSNYADAKPGKENFNLPCTEKSTLAYVAARKFADDKDIIIRNATRGGKLEIFDRIDFDTLF